MPGVFEKLCHGHLILQRHIRQLSIAQVIIFQELKSFLRISIRTWLMDQNPCETSHFLAIGVLTQRCSTKAIENKDLSLILFKLPICPRLTFRTFVGNVNIFQMTRKIYALVPRLANTNTNLNRRTRSGQA